MTETKTASKSKVKQATEGRSKSKTTERDTKPKATAKRTKKSATTQNATKAKSTRSRTAAKTKPTTSKKATTSRTKTTTIKSRTTKARSTRSRTTAAKAKQTDVKKSTTSRVKAAATKPSAAKTTTTTSPKKSKVQEDSRKTITSKQAKSKIEPKRKTTKRTTTTSRTTTTKTPKPTTPKRPPRATPSATHPAISVGFGSVVFKPYKLRKREGHMTRRQQLHFMKILTQWREALTYSVENEQVKEREKMKSLPDPVDQGGQESVFHNELRARDRERQLQQKITSALEKINSGDYGYCETCGVAIGIRRLEARPIATQCVDCKERDEIRERQLGR